MRANISYYFSMLSPWTYLGHRDFVAMAGRHGAEILYKPMNLAALFAETGGLPLARRPKCRQNYRMTELLRWRDKRKVPLNTQPRFWPFDAALADRLVIAAAEAGRDPAAYVEAGMRAVWAEDRNLAEAEEIAAIATASGLDGAGLLAAAQGQAAAERYQANTAEAVAMGCFGAPTYAMDGELFWGQDRLDLLEDMLCSGRPPHRLSV